jgi:hypothetical protein
MARVADVTLTENAWTQLTADDATKITFQNLSGPQILVKGAASATAPTDLGGSKRYEIGEGENGKSLADMFPGITAVRVYAWTSRSGVVVSVDHD